VLRRLVIALAAIVVLVVVVSVALINCGGSAGVGG
jgi:hypothetical protein